MKKQKYLLAILFLMLTAFACALPGQNTASPSAPTIVPGQLETIVAEKVNAALAQTQQAMPLPATSTPEISVTATETPSTEAMGPQSSITNQEDGTKLFVDDKAGFQITISPGWLPLRTTEVEYLDAFSLPQASSPVVQDALVAIQDSDSNVYRLFIFDLQDGHTQNEFVNNVSIIFNSDASISLETEAELKATADSLPAAVPGLVVTSSSISNTLNEIPIGIILSEISSQKKDGSELKLSQKQVFLNLRKGSLVITFTTEQGMKDATLPAFDVMIDSIRIFGD